MKIVRCGLIGLCVCLFVLPVAENSLRVNRKTLAARSPLQHVALAMPEPAIPVRSAGALAPQAVAARKRQGMALVAGAAFTGGAVSGAAVFEPASGSGAISGAIPGGNGRQFVGRAAGMAVALGAGGIEVSVPKREAGSPGTDVLAIRVRGHNGFTWQGQQRTGSVTNYFIGSNPAKWRTGVPQFARAETEPVGGVSLVAHGGQPAASGSQGFEYDLRTEPGVDASGVRLELAGAQNVRTDAAGDLLMQVGGREVRMDAPAIYETVAATAAATVSATVSATSATTNTHTSTRKKATSASRSRKSTSSHSSPPGARRETRTRGSTGSSGESERRRVRKSMRDDPATPHKRTPSNRVPKLPSGSTGTKRATKPKQPDASQPDGSQSEEEGRQPPSRQPDGPESTPERGPEPAQEQDPKGAPTGGGTSQPQKQSGRRVEGGYVLEADGSVGFWIGPHDAHATLVIDPSISLQVTYATFLGGAGADSATSIALDAQGNVYIGGTTTSAGTFAEGANAVEGSEAGTSQLFLAKVAFANGVGALQYLTFFGGSAAQYGGQVAVDASGNAAILGTTTSPDYPTTDGSAATSGLTSGNGNDVVVSEVDPYGETLLFSTIFGGNGAESQNAATGIALNSSQNIPAAEGGIAFDAAGNIYIASGTSSTNLPTTSGAFATAFGGSGRQDAFLAEFEPQNVASGTSHLIYCTYLGTNSDGNVAVGGVAVDSAAIPNVYIAGLTTNSVHPFTPAALTNGFQANGGGGFSSDAFLMKIQPAGAGSADLVYATLLGGAGMDEALGVALDTQTPPNAYVVGATQSTSFPDTPVIPGPATTLHSGLSSTSPENGFLAEISWHPNGALQYFTYLGGSLADAAQSVSAPFADQVYVGGTATSSDFGWHDNVQAFNGAANAFIAKFDTTVCGANATTAPCTASLLYATPLGGTFYTPGSNVAALGNSVAADGQGHVYVAGGTTAVNFPTALTSGGGEINGLQALCASCEESPAAGDAFVAALGEEQIPQPAAAFNNLNLPINFSAQSSGAGPGVPQPVAIVNSGDAPLTISSLSMSSTVGVNGSDFSLSAGSCSPPIVLQPGSHCGASVVFSPTATGVEGGVIAVSDDAPGSPQLLEVIGTGTGGLEISPAGLNFGTVAVGSSSAQTIVLTPDVALNNGPCLNFSAPFSITPLGNWAPCPSNPLTVPVSVECKFEPTEPGTYDVPLQITYQTSDGTNHSVTVPLIGTAVAAAPIALIRPSTLAFGQQSAGTKSGAQPILVANTGSAPLGFSLTHAASLSGTNATEFTESDNCPSSLGVAGTCTAFVAFAPQTQGSKSATLNFTDNASGSPQSITLTGTATAAPQVSISKTAWGFGDQSVGSASTQLPVTVTNVGSGPLSLTQAIAITGADPSDFTQTNNCVPSVAIQPGQYCSVEISFAPTALGSRSASLTIADNVPGSPQTVALTGNGTQANVSISAPSQPLQFSSPNVGATVAAQMVTVTSAGPGQPLTISGVTMSGTNAGDFSQSNTCSGSVTTSCAINITFAPQCPSAGTDAAASRSAVVNVADNGAGSPQTLALTGSITPGFCLTTPASATLSVTSGSSGTFPSMIVMPVGSFTGAITIACSSVPVGPVCTPEPAASVNVSPGVPQTIEIQVSTAESSRVWPVPRPGTRLDEWRVLLVAGCALTLLGFARRFSRHSLAKAAQALAVLILLAAVLSACGAGATDPPSDPALGLPAGNYALTVTVSQGAESIPVHLTLTVQ